MDRYVLIDIMLASIILYKNKWKRKKKNADRKVTRIFVFVFQLGKLLYLYYRMNIFIINYILNI